mgnify:CR=1 FL=1
MEGFKDLLLRAKRGDEDAVEKLFVQYESEHFGRWSLFSTAFFAPFQKIFALVIKNHLAFAG